MVYGTSKLGKEGHNMDWKTLRLVLKILLFCGFAGTVAVRTLIQGVSLHRSIIEAAIATSVTLATLSYLNNEWQLIFGGE